MNGVNVMCAILLSINPVHVENIMNGTKGYEFRKKACKRPVDKIIIYSTFISSSFSFSIFIFKIFT